ncbi:hypothetical protein YA0871_15380 [Pseudomonas paralactis]|uniref:Uncharacterized protein n=1 Tax=Pseudomonas paralactis TaxID=1615673 RepID=A0ABS0V175_9PSED|nr:hypothetical protein [Pseudomonas paralactis]MBC3257885.1 hypothetical protein [Pseudomonas paralactis]MBI6634046.1 hypothetical protein [Pseudomonas paralactis]
MPLAFPQQHDSVYPGSYHQPKTGALWMCGGVFFELDGVVYLNLGLRPEDGNENIECAAEILGSEFEAARQQVLCQRNAA